MGIGEIVLIGLGLSMDAVAVSASNAMCFPRERLRLLEMAAWFAVFQGAMPLAGFLAAGAASDLVTRMGGWLALLILGWVGGQMIRSGLSHEEERCPAGGADPPHSAGTGGRNEHRRARGRRWHAGGGCRDFSGVSGDSCRHPALLPRFCGGRPADRRMVRPQG